VRSQVRFRPVNGRSSAGDPLLSLTRFGPQRGDFALMHNTALNATGKHAETIRHILDPRWHSSFWPNRYISPESAVAHPELPRRTVVMLMEPARSA